MLARGISKSVVSPMLAFNGRATAALSVFADAPTIQAALHALDTVGVDGGAGALTVTGLVGARDRALEDWPRLASDK